ncbi:hypothetical protein MSPP1_000413 [Malassezia sp. CBS 17886]|nr:hypothetical protein MSPP1_000413 [Malassezia sp. CBS 17886]
MDEPPSDAQAPPALDPIHPTLSSDTLDADTRAMAQMAPYVTDPAQFLLNMPVEKPFTTQVPASLFDECISVLKRTVQWRVSSTRYNGALPHGRRYAWRKHYVCDHSGKPRDRRDPNLAPGKRRSRRASIKIGCPASFTATQEIGNDTVTMVCRFQHQGHTVNTREYWASSRIPDNVREWIKDRVHEGHDQKEIVQMIHDHQKNGTTIAPDSGAFIPPGVQITRMDVYNIIKRQRTVQNIKSDTSTSSLLLEQSDAHSDAPHGAAPPRLRLETGAVPPPMPVAEPRRHAEDALASTYPMLPAAPPLAPATPEEAVSFAQQWSEVLANLQALQPRIMEYALTTGTAPQPHTAADWSHAVTQLTQAWYLAGNLLERPVLPQSGPSNT